jgi:hypothetical protein
MNTLKEYFNTLSSCYRIKPVNKATNTNIADKKLNKEDKKKSKKKTDLDFATLVQQETNKLKGIKEETSKKELTPEAKKKRKDRREEFNETLINNYYNTFIKPVEKAANKKFKSNKIKKIELEYALNRVTRVKIYDHNDNLIHDENLEAKIMKYAENKKEANDHNSDVRFNERKKSNMHDNLLNRSLGEENYFNY